MERTELAEAMLDLAGYLNSQPIPNPLTIRAAELAAGLSQNDLSRLALIFEHISSVSKMIAEGCAN